MFEKSKWIWTKDAETANQWSRFTKTFSYNSGTGAMLKVSAETKYYLYVNDRLIVFDGGLFRDSTNGNGYYDEIDLAPYLAIGSNTLTFDVWFYGNGGRNNTRLSSGGIIFECVSQNIFSDSTTNCAVLDCYYRTTDNNPTYLYGGHNVAYDANVTQFSFDNSFEISNYGDNPFGQLEKRPIPLFWFGENVVCDYKIEDGKYIVKLPYAMHVSPYLKVKSAAGNAIDIRSDRYCTNGGPGDHKGRYFGHRHEYKTRDGEQQHSFYNYIFGEQLVFTIPNGVEVLELGYRESSYPTQITAEFHTKNELLNTLLNKCARTLKVCMRENFMDCPDRERGQWIGDVSVQAPQVFLCMDNNAVQLLRKAIYDFFRLRKGDKLVGNVPGENYCELPSQSLNAISEVGMLASYYQSTKDTEVLKLAFEPIMAYLKLWHLQDDGLISNRKGDWEWYDHNFNVDGRILENCWYYSALKYAKFIASELKITTYNAMLEDRINSIKNNFDKAFWKTSVYKSGEIVDDRANAMAVLSGLASEEKYIDIAFVLQTVFCSTTYMEGYVLEALCKMGYKDKAFDRMMSRYYPLIVNKNSTLWEDFFVLGTRNHAWTGSPLTLYYKYFMEAVR